MARHRRAHRHGRHRAPTWTRTRRAAATTVVLLALTLAIFR